MASRFKQICTLLLAILLNYSNAQDPIDYTNFARDRLNSLEKAGKITRETIFYPTKPLIENEEYDFIIIGAGSSGSLIANRLSNPTLGWRILLLEAGGNPDIVTEVPLWAGFTQYTANDWGYKTEPDQNIGLGMVDQKFTYNRGKGLGGTSLLNYMVYSRGQKSDYDSWNVTGWSYEELLPYFKRFERCKLGECDPRYRGSDGEIHVEEIGFKTEVIDLMIEAAKNANYSFNPDYNAGDILGVGYLQATTSDGRRCSGERAFLREIRDRENLIIRKDSHVTKILIDENKTAYGVQFFHNNTLHTATATKEIILSAGGINSPQILMLSGIGPSKELSKHNIKQIHDLPVGKKLTDHVSFWGIPIILKDDIALNQSQTFADESIQELYNKKTGILRLLGGLEGVIFTNLRHPETTSSADMEIMFLSMHLSSDKGEFLRKGLGFTDELYEFFKPLEDKIVAGALPMLLQPKSQGKIELKSNDPFEHPRIYAGYYTDPEDVKTMIAGIRETRRILQSPPLEQLAELYDEPLSFCKDYEFDSDGYWECSLRYLTATVFHYASTCKMGLENDPEAVVDETLRVKGIHGLRVADVSILPKQIAGHTNVPAFMIGEKLSAMVIEDYHQRKIKTEL